MKQLKNRLTFYIWLVLVLTILSIGGYNGLVKLESNIDSGKNITYSNQELSGILSNIQYITGEMFISPGSLDQFLGIIGQAKNFLYLQTYEFTEKRIKAKFSELLNKNVDIKLIMENKKYVQYQNTYKQIQNYFSGYTGFHIQNDDRMGTTYTHSKINLIDSGFIIQTANLTHSSFFSNREYFFWSYDTGVYNSLYNIFQKDRAGERIKKSDIHPNLLICPINCRSVIEYLINSANESIYIQNQYIEDKTLQDLLLDKIKKLGNDNVLAQLPDSAQNKITQKLLGNKSVHLIKKPYIHAKMLLIDKKLLLLGSMNFSANSLDNNREIGILIQDPNIISQFLAQFQADSNK